MDEQFELSLKAPARRALSVTQLVRLVRDALESRLGEYWVVGEVSNARIAPSGHLYFTLKDSDSAISVVMFRSALRRVRFRVSDGTEVVVRGRVNLYEPRGALQLYAEELEPRGLGALQLAFEQLKRRLEAEGLFDPARKRPLPFMPRAVGIVSARRGAALRDIVTIILSRFANTHLIIRPARVQGDGAAHEIAAAIADLNRDGRAEVMIVGRGGGSLEDLWAFNEEVVARAIRASAIPVVSAVGHEVDYTIADFAADLRAPTPTAAGALVVPDKDELRRRLYEAAAALAGAIRSDLSDRRRQGLNLAARLRRPANLLRQARQRLDEAAAELIAARSGRMREAARRVRELGARLRGPGAMVRERRGALERLNRELGRAAASRDNAARLRVERSALRLSERALRAALESRRGALAALAARLEAVSPLRVLERGYAVAINLRDGRPVIDAARVAIGDELELRLARGRLRARTVARDT